MDKSDETLRANGLHPDQVEERRAAKEFAPPGATQPNGNIIPSVAQLKTILEWCDILGADRVELHQRTRDGRLKAWPMQPDKTDPEDRLKLDWKGREE